MPTGKALIDHMQNTDVLPNSLALWGLGQMGLVVKGPDAVVYIDPYLSDSVLDMTREQYGSVMSRAFPPPLLPEDVTNADFFLCTHDHPDHLDLQTLQGAASPGARVVTTGWGRESLAEAGFATDRVIVPEALTPLVLPGTSLRLTAVPAAHYEKTHDPQKGYRWLSFLIEWNGVTLFHTGDTVIYPGYLDTLRELPTPDVAMAAVNGRDWFRETVLNLTGNLMPEEAALMARELGWGLLIPGHNDMFLYNRIPQAHIVDALERIAPRLPFKFLQPGEPFYVHLGARQG